MKAFVTGGTGLLGTNIIQELLGRGHSVTALTRQNTTSTKSSLDPVAVSHVEGDLRNVDAFAAQLADMDVLIHAAACYGEYYRTGARTLLDATNVEGTAALLEAAARQGVRNIVYISSAAVLATKGGQVIDEASSYPEHDDDPYFASKVDAERVVLQFLSAYPHVRIVLILPTAMLGPGDAGPTPTGNFLLKLLRGQIKFVLPGWHRIADARDVASAVVESIQRGKSGERYLVGGRKYSMSEFHQTLTSATGIPTPQKQISAAKLLFASRMMMVSKLTRRPPPIRPNIVKRMQETHVYSSIKAERELGVRFRPLAETLADTTKWFQTEWAP